MRGTISSVAAAVALICGAWLSGCAHTQSQLGDSSDRSNTPAVSATTTPPAQKQDETAAAPDDLKSVLEGTVIHFDLNAYQLTAEDRERLQKLSEVLRAHPGIAIRISGNCDERGTEEYNLALGQERAQMARRYLVDLGIAGKRISTVSYGDERPVDEAKTEKAFAANRRDEFTLANAR